MFDLADFSNISRANVRSAHMSGELFRTIHGSNLYGVAHAGSDIDMFIVTDAQRTKAKHGHDIGGVDFSIRGLDQFLAHVTSGSHQSVEALFSPYKEYTAAGLAYRPLFESMRIGGTDVYAKYERTIKKFSYGDFKRRRHAARLAMNLADLRVEGRFNPRMTPDEVATATELAETLHGDALSARLLDGNLH